MCDQRQMRCKQCLTIDPLPLLMGYGRTTDTGSWVGDVIGVSYEIPEGYVFQKDIWLDW